MKISKRCQYALRAVFELGLRKTDQPVKIQEIAGAQNIPPRFLEVILNQLRHAGFVDSRRGSEGGYMLAQAPEDLTVGQVIRYIQGPFSMTANDDRGLEITHLTSCGRMSTRRYPRFVTILRSPSLLNMKRRKKQQVCPITQYRHGTEIIFLINVLLNR